MNEGNTPLWVACQEGHLSIAELLAEARANVNITAVGFYGRTLLQKAAQQGHTTMVTLLLRLESIVDGKYRRCMTALPLSCVNAQEMLPWRTIEAGT